MKVQDVKIFINELTNFGNSNLKQFLAEGKVEWSTTSYYDIKGKEIKPIYRTLGTYQNYTQSVVWRKNHKTTNRKFSPSKNLLRKVKDKEFYKDFLKSIIPSKKFSPEKVLSDFCYFFFIHLVRAEHKYNSKFIKVTTQNLYDVIANKSIKNVDTYLTNGVWTKREIRIKTKDFEFLIHKPSISTWLLLREQNKIVWGFNSIVEVVFYSDRGSYFFNADYLFTLLSLFGLGSVFSDYSYRFKFFTGIGQSKSSYNKHHRTYYTYEIKKSEEIKLKEFVEFYSDKLIELNKIEPSPSKSQKKQLQLFYGIKVAIDRYRDAILMDTAQSEKRISSAIMGLEALYNYDDKETIGFKLKVRTAKILSNVGFDPIEVAKNVSNAYGIRSKFAHGSIASKKISFEFEEEIINYLRISIVVYLCIDKNKDVLINLINMSMYSKKHDDELTRYIKKIFNNKIIQR